MNHRDTETQRAVFRMGARENYSIAIAAGEASFLKSIAYPCDGPREISVHLCAYVSLW